MNTEQLAKETADKFYAHILEGAKTCDVNGEAEIEFFVETLQRSMQDKFESRLKRNG